ncbi:MAG: PPC domain-containing protein [Bradymonadaceae bacterium]
MATQRFQGRGHIPHEIDINIEETQCSDDGDEENDSQSSATSLNRTEIINSGDDSALIGRKTCDSDADWYCTSVKKNEEIKYQIRFDKAKGDLDAYLFDPSGTRQAKSTSSSSGKETVKYTASSNGQHCVKVQAKTAARNNYKLLTWIDGNGPNDPACPDQFENNDTCSKPSMCQASTATPDNYTGLRSCSGDADWYKTCVEPGQTLTVDADFKNAGGNMDMYLWEEHADFSDETKAVASGAKVSDYSNKAQCYYYKVASQFGSHDYDIDVSTSSAKVCSDDGSEPNNSTSNATSMSAPGLIAERKKCEGDVDWYSVNLDSGKNFEAFIPHDSDVADLDLTLYKGSATNQVASSATKTDDESVTYKPSSSDTFYIKVDTKDRARITYELLTYVDTDESGTFDAGEGQADRSCPDQFENNDSGSGAEQLGVGSYSHLNVCNGQRNQTPPDADFYKIFVPRDVTLKAKATFTHGDGDIDMRMYRGSVGSSSEVSQSPSDTSSSSDNKEKIKHKNSQAGETYYIKLYAPQMAKTYTKNYYDLTLSLGFGTPCQDDNLSDPDTTDSQYEHNNGSQSTAASLSAKDYDGSDSLMLCEKDPNNSYSGQDWYKLQPSSNGQATFALEQRKALGDIHMELRDANGTVATATSELGGNIKLIDQQLTGGTTYYLKVHPDGKVIRNAYDLWASFGGSTPSEPYCPDSYERNDDSTIDVSEPVPLSNDNARLTDPIACGSEQDWYRMDLTGGTKYHLDAFFPHASSTDLALEVQDDSGNLVQDSSSKDITFSNNSSNDDEQATFTPSSTGTYLVGVENKGSGQTSYPMQLIPDKSYNNQSDCPEDSYESTTSIAPGTLPDGSGIYALAICSGSSSADVDHYEVSAKNSGTMTVEVIYNSSQASLGGQLYGPGGNRTSFSSSTNRLEATVSGLSQGDTVDIEVGAAQAGENAAYFLRITN